ncbi:MAG: serine--tRNA ligase [Bacteroidota bacterium]|nr:serine--tRNA ligase [Bacteroidota bacterium]
MLDMKRIRENPEEIRRGIANKNERDRLDELLAFDARRREIIVEVESLKNTRNTVSQEIARLKKAGEDASGRIAEMRRVSDRIATLDAELRETERGIESIAWHIPNMPHPSVPIGRSSAENVEVRRWLPDGVLGLTAAAEGLLDHMELGRRLGILDFERGAKVSGSGFPLYTGKGASLERALINFMLDLHIEHHGYTEVFPPFLVNSAAMRGTGQLPKMQEDMYRCADEDLYLIPTAEVPITNIYRDEILSADELPISLCGYSACFRREAGSYGKQTKGFLRVHQFNKVEMVKFTTPDASYEALETLVRDAEDVLRALRIPYRVILLCTGDMSFASSKTYDIEVWSPGESAWLEASSCSCFEDFQARRANIRFRPTPKSKPEFVHTLNGSGLATSRLMVSLLENNQTREGSVVVPEPLRPYTHFDTIG